MMTKYNFEIPNNLILFDKKRLINQLWKLIPMRENKEDWEKQLKAVIVELTGFNELFKDELDFLILLTKLEGLTIITDFMTYRKTIFDSIDLLDRLCQFE